MPIAPEKIESILLDDPYMMAHPNVVDVIPSLYGVFAVFAFQWTNVGTEKVAIRSSTVTALLRLVLSTVSHLEKCSPLSL